MSLRKRGRQDRKLDDTRIMENDKQEMYRQYMDNLASMAVIDDPNEIPPLPSIYATTQLSDGDVFMSTVPPPPPFE